MKETIVEITSTPSWLLNKIRNRISYLGGYSQFLGASDRTRYFQHSTHKVFEVSLKTSSTKGHTQSCFLNSIALLSQRTRTSYHYH